MTSHHTIDEVQQNYHHMESVALQQLEALNGFLAIKYPEILQPLTPKNRLIDSGGKDPVSMAWEEPMPRAAPESLSTPVVPQTASNLEHSSYRMVDQPIVFVSENSAVA